MAARCVYVCALAALGAAIAAAVAVDSSAAALMPLAGHAGGRWGKTVDGVMGGLSSLNVDGAPNGIGVHMHGNLNTRGGGFVYASANLGEVDARGHEGVVVSARALPPGSAPLTLTLYLADASGQRYEYAHPFTLPAGVSQEERELMIFYLPFAAMEGRVWWRDGPCDNCALDLERVRAIKIYLLFQSGDFDVVIEDVQLARNEDAAPARTELRARLHSDEDVRAIPSAAIGVGAPLYNKGYEFECASHYKEAAEALIDASGPAERVKDLMRSALAKAAAAHSPADAAWALRRAFDGMHWVDPAHDGSIASLPRPMAAGDAPTPSADMMSDSDDDGWDPDPIDLFESADMHLEVIEAIVGAIKEGAPRYNHGDIKGSADVYLETAEMIEAALAPVSVEGTTRTRGGDLGDVHLTMHAAVAHARAQAEEHNANAWALRHAFDRSLHALNPCRWHTCKEEWTMADAPDANIEEDKSKDRESDDSGSDDHEADATEPAAAPAETTEPPASVPTTTASAGGEPTAPVPTYVPTYVPTPVPTDSVPTFDSNSNSMVTVGSNPRAGDAGSDGKHLGQSSSTKGHDSTVPIAAVAGAVVVGAAAAAGVGMLLMRSRRGGDYTGMAIGLPAIGGNADAVPMTAVVVSKVKGEEKF